MKKLISLAVPRKTLEAITLARSEPASAWMNQHSSQDAVTEWTRRGLRMDADVAGLDDDDNPALEEANATADESTEDMWPGGPSSRVPRTQRLRRLRLVQGRRREDSSRLRRPSAAYSGRVHSAISSVPNTQGRGRPNEQVDRGEGDQEDQRADRNTDGTIGRPCGSCSGFITPEDGSDDVSIRCKQLDDIEELQQGDTHGVTRHG